MQRQADTSVRLGVDEDEPVYRFTRLGSPTVSRSRSRRTGSRSSRYPTLDEAATEGSLFALLNERYGITPGEATSTIDAVLPDAATAAALGIGEHAPCLRIRMEYLDQRRRPLMAATDYYAGCAISSTSPSAPTPSPSSGPGGSLG